MVICLFSSPQSFSCSSLPFLRFCFLFILLCVMTTVSRDDLSSSVYSWWMNGIQLRQSENIGRFVFRLCCGLIERFRTSVVMVDRWLVDLLKAFEDVLTMPKTIILFMRRMMWPSRRADESILSHSDDWLTSGFDRLSHRLFGQSNYLNALIEICENGQKWIIFRCITLSSLPLVWSFVRGAVLPAIHTNMRRCTHSLTANFIR